MKIGYACINNSIGCTSNTTFRLKNYSENNLIEKVENNLNCLMKILQYNLENNILFFRISSDLVPFASHEVCEFNWQSHFKDKFKEIGKFIEKNKMRISMHPDQFVLINALDEKIIKRSVLELEYHCEVLDLMELDESAKVQIHVGGAYGDKNAAIQRFIENYMKLPDKIKRRLAIENDDRLFSLKDCLYISNKTGIPIIFDNFHHECLNNGENTFDALKEASKTWKKKDGIIMCDYSSQESGQRKGKHAQTLDENNFKKYLKDCKGIDRDVMLEIKDKEVSALKCLKILEI